MKSGILGVIGVLMLGAQAFAQSVDTVVSSNYFSEPHGLATDADNNLYVADGGTGNRIIKYTQDGVFSALAGRAGTSGAVDDVGIRARFNDPQGMVYVRGGLVIADSGNQLIRFLSIADGNFVTVSNSITSTITNDASGTYTLYTTNHITVTNYLLAGTAVTLAGIVSEQGNYADGILGGGELSFPAGVAADAAGNIYIADWGNGMIRILDTNNVLGTVVDSGIGLPSAVAVGDNGDLWVADSLNNVIYLVDSNRVVTLVAGSLGVPGTNDSLVALEGRLNSPRALLWQGSSSGLTISDTGNNTLRRLYYNFSPDVLGYSLATVAGKPGQFGYTNGTALSSVFNMPLGLSVDYNTSGIFIADAMNRAIRRYRSGAGSITQVTSPTIGWVDFVKDSTGNALSVFHDITGGGATLYNFYRIAMKAETGVETYFTYGNTPTNSFNDTIPNPPPGDTPATYAGDGLTTEASVASIIPESLIVPDLTIKAISRQDGRPSSSIVSSRIQFKTATPVIDGNNSAAITLSDITSSAAIYYTTNGTTPTNDATSFGPVTNNYVLSFALQSDLVLKVRAFRANFQPSEVAYTTLSVSNYVPTLATFGFNTGVEASSAFQGAAGRRFYAPVTLTLNPSDQTVYTMQFSAFVNPGTSPAVPATYWFDSMLKKAQADLSDYIGAGMFDATNGTFESLVLRNPNNNLLLVGWFERVGYTNLYDTTAGSLVSFSQAHNTVFLGKAGSVVAGNYYFDIPASATNGSVYTITLANPSATADGMETAVLMQAYTNGSLAAGKMNSIKQVTVASVQYLVGDVEPFHWFNACDFGDAKLQNNDVIQVFQSACYKIHTPPTLSDMYDSMDSSDGTSASNFSDGSDTAINAVKFGDGQLLVDDVYVTFRRSLDSSLTNYARYWSNGSPYAVAVASTAQGGLRAQPHLVPTSAPFARTPKKKTDTSSYSVLLRGSDIQTPDTALDIPITAEVAGGIPMRVFMMDVRVESLDGSPDVTNAVTFTPVENLASGSQLTMSKAAYDFSGAWLSPDVPGVAGTNVIGTLSVVFPPSVKTNSAYLIHFDHFSASPNGLAIFPSKTQDTLVLFGDRSGSSWNDGIPDAWRLRYFGTVSNLLSAATADADGDGFSNLAEYQAGTSPVDAASKPAVDLRLSGWSADSLPNFTFQFPTIAGQQYSVEYATSVTSTNWTVLSSNLLGDGSMKPFTDPNGTNEVRFYRVFKQ